MWHGYISLSLACHARAVLTRLRALCACVDTPEQHDTHKLAQAILAAAAKP
jgi:hypothetical protein